MRIAFAALLLLTVSCGQAASVDQTTVPVPSSTVIMSPTTTEVVSTTLLPEPDPTLAEGWSESEAERDVSNYLAALAAGAYQQAAWSAENAGVAIAGQAGDETPAEALERLCAGGACAGPYEVIADAPALINPDSLQATSTVTVTHLDSGESAVIRLATFEGQKVIFDLPPLVASEGGPTLVEELFGEDLPSRVVIARFKAFEIWENGASEWITNWFSDETYQIEVRRLVRLGHCQRS